MANEFKYLDKGSQGSVPISDGAYNMVWYSDMPGNCINAYEKYESLPSETVVTVSTSAL